jgi:hypothetical protein
MKITRKQLKVLVENILKEGDTDPKGIKKKFKR